VISYDAQMGLRSLIEALSSALDERRPMKNPADREVGAKSGLSIYARHEFVRGTWRKLTSIPAQPTSGFLSTEEPRDRVGLLAPRRDHRREHAHRSESWQAGMRIRTNVPGRRYAMAFLHRLRSGLEKPPQNALGPHGIAFVRDITFGVSVIELFLHPQILEGRTPPANSLHIGSDISRGLGTTLGRAWTGPRRAHRQWLPDD